MSLEEAIDLNKREKYEEANRIFDQLSQQLSTTAAVQYANNLFYGRGVEKNRAKAYEILDNILEIRPNLVLLENFALLRFNDFDIFSADISEEERKNFLKKTFELFEWATVYGSNHPFIYFNLGSCFESGYGTNIDLKKAQEYYITSLNICNQSKGFMKTKIRSNFRLGRLRLLNRSTFKEALANIQYAASNGLVSSFVYAGRLYYEGILTPKDDRKAFHLFSAASKHGITEAQFYLAEMYEKGIPNICEQNLNKAIELYFTVATVLAGKNDIIIESLPKVASLQENCVPIDQRSIEKLRTYRPQLLNLVEKVKKCESKCTIHITHENFRRQHGYYLFNQPNLVLNNCICSHCIKNCYNGGCCAIDSGIQNCFCDCLCSVKKQ